ncbi:hypothetical protein H0N99_02490 [Candidatus Micrarchaeota archaeon]|nr:hypothetical protein [Candidatus Micrarchaeota archaeon]
MKASKKITACLLLVAIALAGCTYTTTSSGTELSVVPACSGTTVNPAFVNSIWASWQGVSLLAASTVFIVSILIYTLGYALDHQKAIMWAKNQMAEAIIAIVMVIVVLVLISSLCDLDMKSLGLVSSCGGAGESSCNMSDVAFGYLSTMYTTIMQGYLLVIAMNSILTAAASMTLGFAPGGVGIIIAPLAGLAQVADGLLLASIALLTGAIFTLTQMVLLKMTASLFVILFPIGVVLRCFGATRGFGGGLMAIGIGFFVFYPLIAVLFYGALVDNIQHNYSDFSTSFQTAGTSPANTSWFNPDILGFIASFIGTVIMGAIFIPLIMFMILIAFIKGLSMALGEEVDVSNLTRLI